MRKLFHHDIDAEIARSRKTVIYRARRPGSEQRVVLKVLREPRPAPDQIAWFRRELELLAGLRDVEGVIRAHELVRDGDSWAMVLEDIGGVSLAESLQHRPFGLEEALHVCARVAASLSLVHRRDILHKDINPANIVYNRGTGQVRLIDFGIATQLTRESPEFEAAASHEGTLAYISPEQTGRMNRTVDARTDLYSLGATLHHLLTGHPPFSFRDPAALVHAHIARVPARPATVPDVVADIVMRLLAKNAEDRYGSAEGVAHDLDQCAAELRRTGSISSFALDTSAGPVRFTLSQRLYGREADTQRILDAFERAAAGARSVLLVRGAAGIGKSALVHEVHKPITARHGTWLAGKFDQLARDVPYGSLIRCFRSLTRQILAGTEAETATWRARISEVIGPNGRVLLDLMPGLESLLGPRPPVAALAPAESRRRLEHVVGRFIAVAAAPDRPMVLFLDDLQWIDPASLDLVHSLLMRDDVRHLLFVGAYRDGEVAAGHPLLLALEAWTAGGIPVASLEVGPLQLPDVVAFVADTLGVPAPSIRPLAALVLAKTQGNPFFLREFLKALHAEGLLVRTDRWTFDVDAIASRNITDNVVDLMIGRLRALPEATRRALTVAGALGSEIDLRRLAIAQDLPLAATWRDLWPAVVAGLVVTVGQDWKLMGLDVEGLADTLDVRCRFSHDRVQQAAYALATDEERPALHRAIGQNLRRGGVTGADVLFAVVRHLNAGGSPPTPDDARALAALNLEAAQAAKSQAAFAAAREHVRSGLTLLGAEPFDHDHDLAMRLTSTGVETAYQTGEFAQMDLWFEDGVRHARAPLDTAWMQEIKTEAFNAQGRPLDALRHALDYLEQLGVSLPRSPTPEDIGPAMTTTAAAIGGRSPAVLAAMPDIEDPAIRTAVALICKIYSSAYVASPIVFVLVTLRQVELVLRHGNCAASPLAFAVYGLLQAGLAGNVAEGYAYGHLSDTLLGRPDVGRYRAQALHLFSCHTRFWREHLRSSADGERQAWRVGLETGETEFGCYGGHVASKYAFFHGHALGPLLGEIEHYTIAMRRMRNDLALTSHIPWHQAVANLTGSSAEPWRLRGPICDAEPSKAGWLAAGNRMAVANALLAEIMLAYMFGQHGAALALLDTAAGFLDAVLSQFNQPLHYYYDALTRLALCTDAPPDAREAHLAKVEADLELLRGWARSAPLNFAHKVALIEAERLRVLDRPTEARDRYEEAILAAQESAFTNDEALACEAAGRFYLAWGRVLPARHALRDAYDGFTRWGAVTKASALEAEFPRFITPESSSVTTTGTLTTTQHTTRTGSVDLAAVLAACQAISTEVLLPRLLERLVTTAMENAGADRVVLLLEKDGDLSVEAEGTSSGATTTGDGDPRYPESIVRFVARSGESVVLDDALVAPESAADPYVALRRPRSVMCHAVRSGSRTSGILYLENTLAPGVFTPARRDVLHLLAGQMAVSIENARLYANLEERVQERTAQLEARNTFIRQVFGRYMSDEVVGTLLESEAALQLGGERRAISVLFTDVRGFTPLCESLPAEQVVKMLNIYFGVMTRIVHKHHGTIDDIFGDGLLVLFGAPIWRPGHADRALACAIEMQLAMGEVNAANDALGLPRITIGAGVHTGEVIVGNVGSEHRAKYSAVGLNVNIASRVQAMTAGGQVLVTDATRRAVSVPVDVLGELSFTPKGLVEPVVVCEVEGIGGHYEMRLPRCDPPPVRLHRAAEVSIASIDGHAIGEARFTGRITAASETRVEIAVDEPFPPGAELRLEITLPNGREMHYARVVRRGADAIEARLSASSPAVGRLATPDAEPLT